MKKWLVLFLFLLVGCSKEENLSISYDNTYYDVYTPYLESVGNYSLKSYDKANVETMLMSLSMQYFKTNNSYYQEGQYLNKDDLKKLLEEVNKEHSYIKAIYEQNYLASNGVLKGISLAIILDPIQDTVENGKKVSKTVLDDELMKYGMKQAEVILKYVREKIHDERIMIALYKDSDSGIFYYDGITTNDKIKFEALHYHYENLDNNFVSSNDTVNYNYYTGLKESLKDFKVYVSSRALYKENELVQLTININSDYITKSKLLHLTKVVSDNINFNTSVKIYVKNNNYKKALLIKEKDTLEVKIYLLEE